MKTLAAILPFLLFLSSSGLLTGQPTLLPKYEIGLQAGSLVYQGDLTPLNAGSFNTMKPGFGLFVLRNINSRFAIKLQYLYGYLRGDDARYPIPAWRSQRNFNFHSPVTEFTSTVQWNIKGLTPNAAGIINFTPYVFGGVGFSILNIKRDWSGFNSSHFASQQAVINGLAEDNLKNLPQSIVVIPVGLGVRYGISEKVSFTLETAYRFTGTDYLDGFSKAANPDKYDHYHTYTVGLIYSFGKRSKLDCPPVNGK